MIYNLVRNIFPPKEAYRNFIFIPLFFTFYLLLEFYSHSSFLLENFDGRPVSIATFEGIDIAKRVTLFYKAIAISLILLLLFTRIVIILKEYFNEEEMLIANGVSLGGFCLLPFQLYGADMTFSLNLVLSLLLISFAGFVIHLIQKRHNRSFIAVYTWSVLIAVSVFFLQWQISSLAGIRFFLSLPQTIGLVGTVMYILFTGKYTLTPALFRATMPLSLIPLSSFLSLELYMILNQRIVNFPPAIIYLLCISAIIIVSVHTFRKRHSQSDVNFLTSMFRRWIPLILAGIFCITLYYPVVTPEFDWFEHANNILPLHQWFAFNKAPLVESFNAHLLADFVPGLIYSILNGADPLGGYVYKFLITVINSIIIYYFILRISNDGFLAIWISLFYPYTEFLLPSYFSFVPLAAILVLNVFERQGVRNYSILFCFLVFMIFWRVDIGSALLISSILTLIVLHFMSKDYRLQLRPLKKGLFVTFSILIPFFVVALIHSGAGLFVAARDALAYISSMQSYGVKDLSLTYDMKYFSLYFILPVVVILILIYGIFNLSTGRIGMQKSKLIIPVVLLGMFYFFNLQRGLVRHTLAEQWDSALTSFGFFIIASMFLFNFLQKNPFIRFLVFFLSSTLIVSNYVFTAPDLKRNNFYDSFVQRLGAAYEIPRGENITRINTSPDLYYIYHELSEFIIRNFDGKSTFLDFSNTPLLYFFTNRIVPNYFLQIPHTAHNDFLQKRFIDDLRKYDIPVVVFSNVPETFWDRLDGIPNTMRHYRIAEYIYRNYTPMYTLSNHNIWLKNEIAFEFSRKEPLKSYTYDSISVYQTKWIPYTWGEFDRNFKSGFIKTEKEIINNKFSVGSRSAKKLDFAPVADKEYGNYLLLNLKVLTGEQSDATISYGDVASKNGAFTFALKNDSLAHNYLIRISSQYNWYSKNNSWLEISAGGNDIEVNRVAILNGNEDAE